MNQNKLLLTIFTLIFSVCVTHVAFAQDDQFTADFIKSRSYVGVMGISSTVDQWGDFNGTTGSIRGPVTVGSDLETETNFAPAIQRNEGFGVYLGHREGPWAAEVSFWRSDHTGTYYEGTASGTVTVTTPASLQAIDINFKRYFFTTLPTQPFINLGMSFPWLWVRQGSVVNDISQQAAWGNDETFSGIGFDLGAGLEIYLDNGFSLVGGFFQRWSGFNQVNGGFKLSESVYFDGNPKDTGSFEGDGLTFYVGTSFGIQ
jgi:hypothetical protein